MKTPKPIKAWGIINGKGDLIPFTARTRDRAQRILYDDEVIVRVLITPIIPKRKKAKRK